MARCAVPAVFSGGTRFGQGQESIARRSAGSAPAGRGDAAARHPYRAVVKRQVPSGAQPQTPATNVLAFARASSSFAASLPPPRALSGLPPPLPPTIGAMVWIIFPA